LISSHGDSTAPIVASVASMSASSEASRNSASSSCGFLPTLTWIVLREIPASVATSLMPVAA